MTFNVVHTTAANTLSVTIPETTAGNCLVVCVNSYSVGGAQSVSGITLGGSADNFAQAKASPGSSQAGAIIWTDQGCAGGQTAIVISGTNLQVDTGDGGVVIYEISGAATSAGVDKTAANGSSSGTSWSSGATATTTNANEIWIGSACTGDTLSTLPGSPWVNTESSGSFSVAGYQVVSSEAAATYAGTQSFSVPWGAAVITLLPYTAPPGPPAAPNTPLVPPSPFTPASLPQYWRPPPPGPAITFSGAVRAAPAAVAGDQSPPVFTGTPPAAAASVAGEFDVFSFFPQAPLGTKAELLINGTWTDVTSFVLYEQGIKITRGRPDETQSVTAGQCTLRFLNTDGRFSPSNALGAFAPYLGRNTQLRISVDAWVQPGQAPVEIDDEGGYAVDDEGGAGLYDEDGPLGPVNYDGYRFWGEIASFAPGWDESGNFRYTEITGAGPIRRYSQGNATIGSALRRYYTRLAGSLAPYGYWPDEDPQGAQEFASYVNGVPAMGFTGSPSLSSDSGFGGSDAIPAVNSSSWHGQTLAASSPPGTGSITQITPGTYKWTCPPGVSDVTGVDTIGGGGGGGAAGPHSGGGGGGGGGQSAAGSIGVTTGTTYTYVVGAGGPAGVSLGAGGTAGGTSSWTGDTQACTSGGGQGGEGGDTSTGGTGGTGTHAGGTGGTGQSSVTTSGSQYFSGNTGGTGLADGGTATQVNFSWPSPAGITSIDASCGAGGGGGAGGGEESNGSGGGGGGGGGITSGVVDVAPLTTYTFLAGSGGDGGASAAAGMTGAASTIAGASGSITSDGGSGGSGATGGAGGDGGDQGGSFGGNSTPSVTGHGMGGGGGGGGGGGDQGNGGQAGVPGNPRPPGAGGGNGAGGGWGAVSNGGTGAGNGGTGQNGAIGGSGGGGGGGGGAVTNTDGNAGGGGGAGWCYWTWSITGPTGGGGGASGGTSAPGGNGGDDGSPGTAPAGGGTGGYQGGTGILGPALGGGGGGGIPASATTTAAAAVNGAAGQVSFAWSGGAVSPVAADIVRFLLDIDPAGGTDGAVLARIITYGTVERIDVLYRSAGGGGLELTGYNSGGTQLFDSGTVLSGLNGTPVMADIELTENGSGGATWSIAAIEPRASSPLGTVTGTVTGVTVSYVSDVYISPDSDVNFASAGHVAVQTYADPLATVAQVMAGYAGELAETRLARLCAEEGLNFTLSGPSGVTPAMQAQQDDTFPNVLQSCEDADRGLLFEDRNSFGLVYASRVSMQGQVPALTLDYSLAQVSPPMSPVADDQFTRNNIQLTRNSGSSATATQETGPMSVQAPPNGVGDYLYTLTAYVDSDSQLAPMAAWMLIVGTVSDERFPVISAGLHRAEVVSLFTTAAGIDCSDFTQVVNPPSWLTSMPVQQLVWGMSETLSNYTWTVDLNCVPEAPYSTGDPPSW